MSVIKIGILGVPSLTNPTILKLQARKQAYDRLMNMLDDDVQALIVSNDSPQDKARLNAVIRAMFATV